MSRQGLKNVSRLIAVANNEVPIEQSFLQDLCRSIEMNDEKGSQRLPSPTFKPSGMRCRRMSYYNITQAKPDEGRSKYTMVGICGSGSDIHIRIQTAVEQMKENGIDCEYVDVGEFIKHRNIPDIVVRDKVGAETKLYNSKYNISFMCDGLILYKGKYYILEIKTETSNKFYYRNGVDPKHHNQAIAYSLSLQLDNVLFLYINRDLLEMKAFMFNVNDDMRNDIIKYIESTNEYVEKHIAPPKVDDKAICRYCNYTSQCRKDG